MKATVVIVTYNRLELLKECIECVEKQTLPFEHIVIVDNKSTDGTTEFLKDYIDKYHIIFESENGGGAKGFKDGIEYAYNNLNTDWILVIDDDAMLSANYLQKMAQASYLYKDVLAFSGNVITENKIDLSHRKKLNRGLTFSISPVPRHMYDKQTFEYDLSSFCGLFFRKSLIKKIGYPKEEYFIWYDDSEYSLRIRKESKIINITSASINHKTKLSNAGTPINWKGYYGIRNTGDVIKSHGKRIQLMTFFMRTKIAQYKNMLIYLLSRKEYFKYCSDIYKDALCDLKDNKLGYNPKYHA